MELTIKIAQFLLSLSILIVVHEWGHFYASRLFKIKVEKFYLFFDFLFPMANVLNFSLIKFKKGDTEFGLGWFPLGGYVKIAGMVDESMDKEQMQSAPQPWEFRSKPAWQRLIVMMGGIIVNVVVGVLIFIGITYSFGDVAVPKDFVNSNGGIQSLELGRKIGLKTGDKIIKINGQDFENFEDLIKPNLLLSENASYTVLRDGQELEIKIPENFIENFNSKEAASTFIFYRVPAIIGQTSDEVSLFFNDKGEVYESKYPQPSLAKTLKLKAGDQILEVFGQPINYQDELISLIKSKSHDSISLKVKRGDQILHFNYPFKDQAQIGFIPMSPDKSRLQMKNYSFAESVVVGTGKAFTVVWLQMKAIWKIITLKISAGKSLSGPGAMVGMFSSTWDWESFWRLTGMLSMVLAFMNFLPIPALDGGYVIFLLYEMISGRAPSEKFFENSIKVGMAILLLIMAFAIYNDFTK